MLIQFKIANFRSLRDEQVFSLVASNYEKELAEENTLAPPLPGLGNTRILKGAGIFGANASGKSNLLGGLQFLAAFVRDSATRVQPGEAITVAPFKLDQHTRQQPTRFELIFVTGGCRYQMGLEVDCKRVLSEYLLAFPKGKAQCWYEREFDPETGDYQWSTPGEHFKHDEALRRMTRPNSLFLSVAAQFNHPRLSPVFSWFVNGLAFAVSDSDTRFNPERTLHFAEESLENPGIVRSILRGADLGIDDFRTPERTGYAMAVSEAPAEYRTAGGKAVPSVIPALLADPGDSEDARVTLLHRGNGDDPFAFDFNEEESSGTRRLFALLGPWIEAMQNGRVLFVDSIESNLHPLLVRELIRMAFTAARGDATGQIVFTSHSPTLLERDILRRDQIWFMEKDHLGGSHLYPLTDYKPRKDEALSKGYLAGRYGAVPNVFEGLRM